MKNLLGKFKNFIQFLSCKQLSLTPREDRLKHFFWGNIFSLIGIIGAILTGKSVIILFLPFILGFIKEISDEIRDGSFDKIDLIYTSAPGILFWICYLI